MDRSRRRQQFHHLARAAVLAGFAGYVLRLARTDSLTLYIAPRMAFYVKLAALGLYVIAAVLLVRALRLRQGHDDRASDCGCEHVPAGPAWRSILGYGLFVLPLLAGFLTPDAAVGSAMAGQKGMRLSLDAHFPAEEYAEAYAEYAKTLYAMTVIAVPERRYTETLTTLDMYLDQFAGKRLTISGFVYRDDDTGTGRFVLGRFAVQCCAADAMPYGVMVTGPDAARYAEDEWLTVTGILEKTTYRGETVMGLKMEKAVRITASDEPYVYPDLEFGLTAPNHTNQETTS